MLKVIQNAAVIAAFAFVVSVIAGAAILGSSKQPVPNEHAQPAKAKSRANENERAIVDQNADRSGNKGANESHWYDHITDWLLVLFNALLFVATVALFISAEKAANAAKQSADAAWINANAVRQSIDLSVATQRASITVASINSDPVAKEGNPDLIGWAFSITWQNKGPTRTGNLRVWFSFRQFEPDIPADFPFAPAGTVEVTSTPLDANSQI